MPLIFRFSLSGLSLKIKIGRLDLALSICMRHLKNQQYVHLSKTGFGSFKQVFEFECCKWKKHGWDERPH